MTNVLIISDATLDGGTNQLIYHQLRTAKTRPDICVSVLLDDNENMLRFRDACRELGVPVYLEKLYHGRYPEQQILENLHRILQETKPDVVHVYCASIRSCIAIRESVLRQGLPLVMTEAYLPRRYPVTQAQLARVKEIYAKAKAVIMVCRANIAVVRDVYHIEAGNIYHIPTSIDTRDIKPVGNKTARPLRALLLGRLTAQKGMDVFIEAFRRLSPSQREMLQADICGDGEDREALQSMVRRYKLESNIHLLGYQPDIFNRIGEYDLAIIPSRDEGGLPHVILELLAAGLPCVVSNISGLQEAVDFGNYGLLFSPEDPEELKMRMETVIENPSVLREKATGLDAFLRKNYDRETNYSKVMDLWMM